MSREIGRRFHFIREIASGGFGSVYLAKVTHPDGFSRIVAVKLLLARWQDSDEVARRTRDEARLLGLLRHKNIVDVIDLTSIEGRAAVIMEYIEAVDLRWLVEHLKSVDEVIEVRAALEITAAVAGALDAAYNRPPFPGEKPLRVIHRDIKPSNIMVDDAGTVKVLDFGIARSELEGRESQTREITFGSVEYMAPERLFLEPETPASDIYSLGATLFELLALEPLGRAKGRAEKHAAQLDERLTGLCRQLALPDRTWASLSTLLRRCLAHDHRERPTAGELARAAKDLARTLDGGLDTWAERVLPPLVALSQERPHTDPLTDSVLVEDSIVFRDDRPATEVDTPSTAFPAVDEETPTGVTQVVPADDEQAAALAALDTLHDGMIAMPPTGSAAHRVDALDEPALLPPADPHEPTDLGTRGTTATESPPVDEAPPGEPTAPRIVVPREPTRRSLALFGGLAVAAAAMLVVAGSVVVVGATSGAPGEAEPAPQLVPIPAGAPTAGAVLRSAIPDLRKLTASCGSAEVEGEREVHVPADGGTCTVTAILATRERRFATVEVTGEGTWLCFAGEDACTRQ